MTRANLGPTPPYSGKIGFRSSLSSVPSIDEIESELTTLIETASGIGPLYREAQSIAYDPAGASTEVKVMTDMSDPTSSSVMAGYLNGEADFDPDTGLPIRDQMSTERTALRSAVDALNHSLAQLRSCEGRLRSILHTNEQRGRAGRAMTWGGLEAERRATDRDHAKLPEGLTDPRWWRR